MSRLFDPENDHIFSQASALTPSTPSPLPCKELCVDTSPLPDEDIADLDPLVLSQVMDSTPTPTPESHTQQGGRPSLPGIATIEDEQRFTWPSPVPPPGLAALSNYASDSDISPERPQPFYNAVMRSLPGVEVESTATNVSAGGKIEQVGGGREATPPRDSVHASGLRSSKSSRLADEFEFEEVPLPPPPPNFHIDTPRAFGPVPTCGKGRGGRNITRASSATHQATAPPLATIDTVPTTTERATPLAPHTAPPPAHTTQAPSGTSHNVATGSPPVTIGAATGPAVAVPLCEDGDATLEGDLYDSNRLNEEEDSPALKGKVGRPSNLQVRAVGKLLTRFTRN
ncbi:hypothetical protein GGX14DRAFT_576015 [Mycena pura]|uniref:Uncharacterized protein n=1 Tax=Mycena pura TaxID=153505 RepID=A0AAD6UVW0_9AGAR|nr:hypothetical protein GGX14DRAFT_576015 [Mycena pura]